jgi:hypothetical protein
VGAVALSILSALASLDGCAHVAAPPGGPEDTMPPTLIAVEPDSLSVVPGFEDDVRFTFDETISERGIQGSTTVYPLGDRTRAKKGGRELRVRPREGWVADRIYHIRVEPVIADLFQNRIEDPIEHVISTGIPITGNRVQGIIYDRITAEPLRGGRIDMVRLPDTLRYGGVGDSIGAFGLGTLPEGDYLAIGYDDVNNNQTADDFDRSDTVRVSLGATDTLALEFQVFHHDTVGPQLAEVQPVDTMIVELQFDGYLDPDIPLSTDDVEIFSLADSIPIPLDKVLHAWQYTIWRDSVEQARRAEADSVAAALADSAAAALADSLAAALADSLAAADTVAAVDTVAVADSLAAALADSLAAGADTLAQEPEAAPAQPPPAAEVAPEAGPEERQEIEEPPRLPDKRIYIVASGRIPTGTHVVLVGRLVNLNGLEGGGEKPFEPIEPEAEEPEQPPEPPGRPRG